MLILTRRMGESIRIGDDITVLITGVDQNKVKIGITSPRHIPIYREELYLKIQQENKEAAGIEQGDLDEILELVTE
jgi:carbon storage regulator